MITQIETLPVSVEVLPTDIDRELGLFSDGKTSGVSPHVSVDNFAFPLDLIGVEADLTPGEVSVPDFPGEEAIKARTEELDPERLASLASDLQMGNKSVFTEIYRTLQPRILSFLTRKAGIDRAEDLAQETFLKVFKNINQFKGGAFLAWVYKIANNNFLDEVRRTKNSHTVVSEDAGEDVAGPIGLDPEAVAIGHALVEEVFGPTTNHLQKDVLSLDSQGYSYLEISEMLGIPEGTVKSRLSRAKVAVKYHLLQDTDWVSN